MATPLPLRIPWRAIGGLGRGFTTRQPAFRSQACTTRLQCKVESRMGMGIQQRRNKSTESNTEVEAAKADVEIDSSSADSIQAAIDDVKVDASPSPTVEKAESAAREAANAEVKQAEETVERKKVDEIPLTHGSLEQSSSASEPTTPSMTNTPKDDKISSVPALPEKPTRRPRAEQAAYLAPMKREPTYNLPVAELQLRSYNVRSLEFMADFALRAAYFLNLPASGPVPLPKMIQRWTVPRGHFIHKKKQENYERITYRRLIQIKDGSAESVELWLAFLRKHGYYGIGMKANVYEFAGLHVAKDMDAQMERMRKHVEPVLGQFAFKEGSKMADGIIERVLEENRRAGVGWQAPQMVTPLIKRPININESRK